MPRPVGQWRLSLRSVASAAVLVASLAGFLLLISSALSPGASSAAYAAVLCLLPFARSAPGPSVASAAGWTVLICLVGALSGPPWSVSTLSCLLLVTLIAPILRVGGGTPLPRAPVNLFLASGLAASGVPWQQLVLGSCCGAVFVLTVSTFTPSRANVLGPAPEPPAHRAIAGLGTALGLVLLLGLAAGTHFAHVEWAMLSFCLIAAAHDPAGGERGSQRVLGTMIGVLLGTALALLPGPFATAATAVCMVLCVAYQLAGNYTLFVTLLTPTVLLLGSADVSPLRLGLGRVEAVVTAVAVAWLCTWLVRRATLALPSTPSAPGTHPSLGASSVASTRAHS